MSATLIALAVAGGTPLLLVALAYAAALSAHRQQALQDEEFAKLWTRAPARTRPPIPALPVPAMIALRSAASRRMTLPPACIPAKQPVPLPRRAAGKSRR
jgi:hypothetical protein